jgi:hypothetical protein
VRRNLSVSFPHADDIPQPLRPSLVRADSLDELAHHVDGTFVLVVRTTGGKYRRRCFLSVAAAERAVRNAQADGHNATIYLAELRPLWKLTGGET